MTREDVERLMHCARHEAQGAGPNTLAEVCEWALGADRGVGSALEHCEIFRARAEDAEKRLKWMCAAHWLLANEEAFISPENSSPFFFLTGVLKDGTPTLSLNVGDTFYYACADAEPFRYEDAPALVDIAKREGWAGLAKWAAEQRKARGEHHEFIKPVADSIGTQYSALKTASDRVEAAEAKLAKAREALRLLKEEADDPCRCFDESRDFRRRHLLSVPCMDAVDAALSDEESSDV